MLPNLPDCRRYGNVGRLKYPAADAEGPRADQKALVAFGQFNFIQILQIADNLLKSITIQQCINVLAARGENSGSFLRGRNDVASVD